MLLPCIKRLTFVLQAFFALDSRIYLNGFNTIICFQIIRPIIFSSVKKFFAKKDQGNFPQTTIFLDQQNFPQTRKFSMNKFFTLIREVFHKQKFSLDQGSFLQTKIFPWSNKFFIVTKISASRNQNHFLKAKIVASYLLLTNDHTCLH